MHVETQAVRLSRGQFDIGVPNELRQLQIRRETIGNGELLLKVSSRQIVQEEWLTPVPVGAWPQSCGEVGRILIAFPANEQPCRFPPERI